MRMLSGIGAISVYIFSAVICASSASASVTYTYIGNTYTQVYGSGYRYSDHLIISFTVPNAIDGNFSGSVFPMSFTAYDTEYSGAPVFCYPDYCTAFDEDSTYSFMIQTDSLGTISKWGINIYGDYFTGIQYASDSIYTYGGLGYPTPTFDKAVFEICSFAFPCSESVAQVVSDPGVWLSSASPVIPEPATWAMIGLGFAGLGIASKQWRVKIRDSFGLRR